MVKQGRDYIEYTGYNNDTQAPGIGEVRAEHFRNLMYHNRGMANIGEIKFKDGVSSQEALVILPAIIYDLEYSQRPGDVNSPFKFFGWDKLSERNLVTNYHMAHDSAKEAIQELKDEINETLGEEEYESGLHYGSNLGLALYDMFKTFRIKNIDPGFLGWSHNETMVKFLEDWSDKFEKLSDNAKKVATFTFLEGVKRGLHDVKYPHMIPPVSKRKGGKTLLEPGVMKKYFKEYNKALLDPNLIRDDNLKRNSRHNGLISFTMRKCR